MKPWQWLFLIGAMACVMALHASGQESPIEWTPPPGFDARRDGLGLAVLPGVEHETIYDPVRKPTIRTIDGQPTEQGWLNHHSKLLRYQGRLIVTWTSHLSDENGPGQRILARSARLSDEGETTWSESIVELSPSPVAMKPRTFESNPDQIDGPYVVGRLMIIGGRLYFKGSLRAYDGWTDQMRFHGDVSQPIPAENYRDDFDRDTHFIYDVRRDLGLRFIQAWDFKGDELVPATAMYLYGPMIDSVEVTPGRVKPVVVLRAVYQEAQSIDKAPQLVQQAVHAEPDEMFERMLPATSDAAHVAADGHNGLAHWAEFQRPDGKWVVVRDNLENRGFYYAAIKDDAKDTYPPAVRTNLFGDVDPEAGELPDGRVWILGNDYKRIHMYLTLSDDGIHFNRTWLVRAARIPLRPGLGKTDIPNGPQYPQTLLQGRRLLVIYSVGKQQIAMSSIPLEAFQ